MSTASERAVAASLTALGGFQVGLVAGAPWGRAAYGGGHSGTLPTHLRTVSAVAALGYAAAAALVLCRTGTPQSRDRAFTALAVAMGAGSLVNAASRSPVERAIWTPVTAVTGVLAWRSRTTRG